MAHVGNRLVLESERVGQPSQTEIVIGTHGQLLRVRWDSGNQEPAFTLSAGSLQVIGRKSEGQRERP
jgi:hypothetical protein